MFDTHQASVSGGAEFDARRILRPRIPNPDDLLTRADQRPAEINYTNFSPTRNRLIWHNMRCAAECCGTAMVPDMLSIHEITIPRLAYKIEEAPIAAGVSRTRIFEAIRDRELVARKAGKATVILADELLTWLKNLPSKGSDAGQVAA
jgi:hypothetical protein